MRIKVGLNRVLTVLLILVSVIPACTSKSNSLPTATPLPGFKRFDGGEMEIWLPESFEGGNLSEDLEVIVEKLRMLGPDFQAVAQMVEQNPSMFVLLAVDQELGPSGFLTNVNVIEERILSTMTLEMYYEATSSQMDSLGANVLAHEIVQLGDTPASRMIADQTTFGSRMLQYHVKDGNSMWVITFSAGLGEFEQKLPEFEQSMLTFALTD